MMPGPTVQDEPQPEDAARFIGTPDGLERLWTPHRMAYVADNMRRESAGSAGSAADQEARCPFCVQPEGSDDDSLIVHRGELAYVVLNLFPYNTGHLLICPYRHVADYPDLTAAERVEIAELSATAMTVIRAVSKPHGFNLGMNQGAAGGAGIAAHLHQHVVPRWQGDSNFFPIIAQTKALPQLLSQTRELLSHGWQTIGTDSQATQGSNSDD